MRRLGRPLGWTVFLVPERITHALFGLADVAWLGVVATRMVYAPRLDLAGQGLGFGANDTLRGAQVSRHAHGP